MMTKEEWKDVDGYDGKYKVSNLGRVKGMKFGNILRGFTNKNNGYHQVMLYKEAQNKLIYVHKLVADAFLPPPENGEDCIYHLNGKKTDNRACNLAYKFRSRDKNIEFGIDTPKRKMATEYAYIIRRYNLDGKCMQVYTNWKQVEAAGYKRSCVMQAARGKYSIKHTDVYKKNKWDYSKKD